MSHLLRELELLEPLALALDRDLLRDLLGAEELRELIDADVLADLELELQRLVEGRLARDVDELHDQLRLLGPLSIDLPVWSSVDWPSVLIAVGALIAVFRFKLGILQVLGLASLAGLVRLGLRA